MTSLGANLRTVFLISSIAGLFIVSGLLLAIPSPPRQQAPPATEGGERYLTHIALDKPIYRTGEKVYVRAVILNAQNHSPLAGPQNPTGNAFYDIKGPRGETVASGVAGVVDSVAGFSWDVPPNQAGGEYTLRIFHASGDAPAERKFDIRGYRAPRLKSQIVFVRDGYGPGDTVSASLHVERAEGGIPSGARVSVTARVDGIDVWRGETIVDASGNAGTSFKLPPTITRGEGVLVMTIPDGGVVETATKTIPILLQTLDLAFYPEGGDLIAGLPNRVYVQSRTPAQKPADMAGIIVNAAGREVANFRTEHEGRGRFTFVPARGERYSLRVIEPAGIEKSFPLPEVRDSGVIVSSASDVIEKNKDVVVRVGTASEGTYGVALYQRGKEISFKEIHLRANQSAEVSLTVPRSVDGVIVVTVYDALKTPLAERLVFRQPEHRLNVAVTADRTDYAPGDKVTLRVATRDDSGKPVGAVVGLTVTDSSVLEMIEKREQAPRLPVMVLLESDARDLADAHVYLDETNPNAARATDLLLGTQGWRRFATADSTKFIATYNDAARRVLAVRMLTDAERARVQPPMQRAFAQGVAGGVLGGVIAPEAVAFKAAAPPVLMEAMKLVKEEAQGQAGARLADAFGGRGGRGGGRGLPAGQRPLIVREYAHTLRPGWTEGSRVDFAETVYWNAGVKTDPATGMASVSFNLSDSVTAFRVMADGFTANGSLGSGTSHVESVQPFSIEPKLPLQVTSGDVIQLPVGIINGMNRELAGTGISLAGASGIRSTLLGDAPSTLNSKERARRLVQLNVAGDFSGMTTLTIEGKAGNYRDTVIRKLDVQPAGFPFEASKGGVLEPNGSRSFEFTLPNEIVRGSVATTVAVYPTPLASMTDALQSLLRQPYGCFEQTSSTSYPLVMAQQYFLTHSGIDPTVIEKARDLLEASYKRLTGFESPKKGYEWFGADPGHEALTAYGLMQFTDMSQVRNVDKEMVDRTRAWLLGRRDGDGGYSLNSKALDSFGRAPVDTTNAYITWALIESGEKGLTKEIAAVKASANASQDSYIVALAANILHGTGDRAGARLLMDKLARNQEAAGSVKGASTSITRSGGEALTIETTALSILAWMREPEYAEQTQKGLRWIVESNKSGRFGSTQSTILALRAIVAYDAAHARPKAPGRLVLTVDGKAIGTPLAFTPDTQGTLMLPEFAGQLGSGSHTVALKMEEGSSMPFSVSIKYNSILPDSSEHAQVGIQVGLRNRQIQEGGVTEAIVSVANKSNEAIPTPVAIVGIPGGLEVRHDQLKELVKSGKIDAYEVLGREVVLYWRYIKANDKFDLPLSVVAAIPGSYTGPASRAYLYYTDEYKTWAPGVSVTITPR